MDMKKIERQKMDILISEFEQMIDEDPWGMRIAIWIEMALHPIRWHRLRKKLRTAPGDQAR